MLRWRVGPKLWLLTGHLLLLQYVCMPYALTAKQLGDSATLQVLLHTAGCTYAAVAICMPPPLLLAVLNGSSGVGAVWAGLKAEAIALNTVLRGTCYWGGSYQTLTLAG